MLSIALKSVLCEFERIGMHAYQPVTLSTGMQVSTIVIKYCYSK